ncbi:MAG: transcriptional regulator [Lachnospiraceae bacterium]
MEINAIPEAFQSKLRLAVLSSLLTGKKTFRDLKKITGATDGNLGAQLKKLEEMGYVVVDKEFVNNKPQSTCVLTGFGKVQFKEYVELLEGLLKMGEKESEDK